MNGSKLPRSSLFGRKDFLEVYRQAKDFIIRYKLLRICRFSEENGLKRLTICNLWRIDREEDGVLHTFPLPPLGKIHFRLVGASLCAGTLFKRRFALLVLIISPMEEKTVCRVGYARQFSENIWAETHGAEKSTKSIKSMD